MKTKYRERKHFFNKKGFTLMEVVITVCVLAVLLTAVFLGMASYARAAYSTRANDTAKSVFLALQSSLTQAKVDGTLEEMFNPETSKYFKKDDNGNLIDKEGNVVTGTDKSNIYDAYSNYAFLPNSVDKPYITTVKPELPPEFDTSQYIYMAMDRNSNKDSKLLYDLIESKVSDKEILQNSILVEINPVTAVVRSVFYTEKIDKDKKLDYARFSNDNINISKCNYDVYSRDRNDLKQKQQGYYGSNSVGYDEYIGKLDDPKVKIYNDDRLVIEWDEIKATNFAENNPNLTDEQKKDLEKNKNKVRYDFKIVNADDTTKEYVTINDISYYDSSGTAGAGNSEKLDIYSTTETYWESEKNPRKDNLVDTAKSDDSSRELQTIENNVELEKTTETNEKHRIYYSEGGKGEEAGKYRLILDSLDVSVSEMYPTIPWDENIKVVVEAKYMDVGFTSSMSITSDTTNAYFGMKIIEAEKEQPTGIKALFKDLFNQAPKAENIKYELGYSRHLNNIRYIISDDKPKTSFFALNADGTDTGYNANFKVTNDIDWSVLSLGKNDNTNSNISKENQEIDTEYVSFENQDLLNLINKDEEKKKVKNYKLQIENTPDRTVASLEEQKRIVRGFNPLSTIINDENKSLNTTNNGYQGNFDGLFQDSENENVKEIYSIKNLAIYDGYDNNNGTITINPFKEEKEQQTGLFDIVGKKGIIQNVNIVNTRVYAENTKDEFGIGAFAGKVQGKINNVSVKADEDSENALGVKHPLSNIGGNVIEGTKNVGGIAGILESSSPSNIIFNPKDDNKIGFILSADNGEVIKKDDITEEVKIGVTVKGNANIGGIVGISDSGNISNSINTANIEGKDSNPKNLGGILGVSTGDTAIDGTSEFEYTNYGIVNDNYMTTSADEVRDGGTGGIIGQASGTATKVNNTFNKGKVTGGDNTGGIVGFSKKLELTYSENTVLINENIKNANNAKIEGGRYNTGGIIGYIPDKSDTSINNGFNSGEVTGVGNTGGLVGRVNNEQSTDIITTYDNDIKSHINANKVANNSGKISGSNSTGGIFGVTDGAIINMYNSGEINGISNGNRVGGIVGTTTKLVEYKSEFGNEGRFSNVGAITAAGDLVGGVIGEFTSNENVINATNSGKVLGRDSVGGIIGSRPKNTEFVEIKYNDFVLNNNSKSINKGSITASYSNAGGIIGNAEKVSIINPFNGGEIASNGNAGEIASNGNAGEIASNGNAGEIASNGNAGGIAGRITETKVHYDYDNVKPIANMVYTNNSTVKTYDNSGVGNKGGIVGQADGKNEITDMFNAGTVHQGENTGGIIGYAIGTEGEFTTIKNQKSTAENVIDNGLRNNIGKIGSNSDSNVGGIVGKGSFVEIFDVYNGNGKGTNTTIQGKVDVGGIAGNITNSKLNYDNNLIIKPSKNKSNEQKLVYVNDASVISDKGSKSTGGIVGNALSSNITNTLNSGNVTGNAGVNIGGIIGNADNTKLNYDKEDSMEPKDKVANIMINNGLYTNTGVIKGNGDNTGGIIGMATGTTSFNDVYNGASVTNNGNNTGGIVGSVESSDVKHEVTTSLIKFAIEKDMGTNVGSITGANNVGGIYGKVVKGSGTREKFEVKDVFNHSVKDSNSNITGKKNNVGGIAGNANYFVLDFSSNPSRILKSNKGIKELIKEDRKYRYTNTMVVNASTNVGGVIGNGTFCDIKDVYNSGGVSGTSQVGGILGNASSSKLTYETVVVDGKTDTPSKPIPEENNLSRYTNIGTISGESNAGGIAGQIAKTLIQDTFNKGNVSGKTSIGGLVGLAENSTTVTYTLQVGQGKDNKYGNNNSPFDDEIVRNNPYKTDMFPNIGTIGRTDSTKVGGLVGSAKGNTTIEKAIEIKGEAVGKDSVGGAVGYLEDSIIENVSNSSLIKGVDKVGGIAGTIYTSKTEPLDEKGEKIPHITKIKNVRNYSSIGDQTNNAVGGIVGYSDKRLENGTSELSNLIDTTQNFGSVSGRKNIGGVLGESKGPSDTKISMSKNDVNASEDFSLVYNTLGGNVLNKISGVNNIGGISGNGCAVSYSSNTGHIEGTSNVGGISGEAYQIDVSFNTGNVKGKKVDEGEGIGGIAGKLRNYTPDNLSHIKLSHNGSQVVFGSTNVGGIAGVSEGLIHQSYNAATVENPNNIETSAHIGGIVGWLKQTDQKNWFVQYCYNVGRIGTGTAFGSIIGKAEGTGADAENIDYIRVYNSYHINDYATRYLEIYYNRIKIQLNYDVPIIGQLNAENFDKFVADKGGKAEEYDYKKAKLSYENMGIKYYYVSSGKTLTKDGNGEGLKNNLNDAGSNFSFLESEDNKLPIYEYPVLKVDSANKLNGYNQIFKTETQVINPYKMSVWPTSKTPYLDIGGEITYDKGVDKDIEREYITIDGKETDIIKEMNFKESIKFSIDMKLGEDTLLSGRLAPIYSFNIYDGFSIGNYTYDNNFKIYGENNTPKIQSYYLVKEHSGLVKSINEDSYIPVNIAGVPYYFYRAIQGSDKIDENSHIRNVMAVKVTSEGICEMLITSKEMDSYNAAYTGYFTLEAQAIFDSGMPVDTVTLRKSKEFSGMFSMHFSNSNVNKKYNNSIFNEVEMLETAQPNLMQTRTAALGSTKLDENKNIVYDNMLEITNERHLNNLNKNMSGGIGSDGERIYLPYINKQSQMQNNIELMKNPITNHNNLILGRNKKDFSRFTGTLDGNGHAITNIKVDTSRYNGYDNDYIFNNANNDITTDDYGLIYELSGGVVKNLTLQGNVKSGRTGGIAHRVSNGRNIKNGENILPDGTVIPVPDTNNEFGENLGYEPLIEQGRDAKIYNNNVGIEFSGSDVGGFVNKTVRRFNNSEEVDIVNKLIANQNVADKKDYDKIQSVLTATNNTFSGTIGAGTTYASGFISLLHGKTITNDILSANAKPFYQTNVNIDNFRNTGTISGYNASGVVGASYSSDEVDYKNSVTVVNSANNGSVIGVKNASGIVNGYFRTAEHKDNNLNNIGASRRKDGLILLNPIYKDSTIVKNSVNNGLVYSSGVYDENYQDYVLQEGIAAGIGVNVGTIENSGNNGTVESTRVAAGVTYSNIDTELINDYVTVGKSFNTGLVKAKEKSAGIAVKDRYSTKFEVKDSFNSGTVLVETNISDDYAHRNSYAGGIMAWAGNSNIADSYNVGTVAYVEEGKISYDNRNVGGIVGGAVDSKANVENSYNLSDNQVKVIPQIYSTNAGNYNTDGLYNNGNANSKLAGYRLRAVGDSVYGKNVTNLNYSEMINQLNYYNQFKGDIWKIGNISDVAMNVPQQFNNIENTVDKNFYYIYNNANEELNPNTNPNKDTIIYTNNSIENLTNINSQTNGYEKNILENKLKYRFDVKQPKFDNSGLTQKEYVSNPVVDYNSDKTYSVTIPNYDSGEKYSVTIYDGDAFSQDYTAMKVREYKIVNGTVTSDDKLAISNLGGNQYFDETAGLVSFVNGKLTISKQEGLNFYMPINGYYTTVVTKDGSAGVNVSTKPTQEQTSQKFNIHFANTVTSNNSTWNLGQASTPFEINDQYGIVGMTTSGISKSSTKDINYKLTENITIDIPFYSMFEFEGVFDGDNKSVTYKSGSNNLGFINKLKDGEVKNLTINFADENGKVTLKDNRGNPIDMAYNETTAQGEYSADNIGKYLEDTGYRANVGLVSNYVFNSKVENEDDIKSKIDNAKINGKIKLGDRNKLLINDETKFTQKINFNLLDKKITDNTYDFASVSGVVGQAYNQAQILNTYSNVDITAQYNNLYDLSGVAGKLTKGSKIVNSINNGDLTNSSDEKVENKTGKDTIKVATSNLGGVVMTMDKNIVKQKSNSIEKSFNSGTITAKDNIAGGLVGVYNNGKITNSYNSGYIIARREEMAGGTAGGVIGTLSKTDRNFEDNDMSDKIENVYNSGVVRGMYQGGIVGNVLDDGIILSNGTGTHGDLFKNVYMLKDENLYWKDKFILTDKNILGFAYEPSEYWEFAKSGTQLRYKEIKDKPYIKTYTNMQDLDNIKFNGADWRVDKEINKNLPNQYPLPQLIDNGHNTPINKDNSTEINGIKQDINQFPEYTGLASSKNKTDEIIYIPYAEDELFTDTIKIDLKDISDISEYNVILTNGDFKPKGNLVSEDLEEKVKGLTSITIKRNYIDSGTEATVPTGPQYTTALKDKNGNGYYYEILSDEKGVYRAKFTSNQLVEDTDKLSIQVNNDYLDTLTTNKKPYYSIAVMAKVKENDTEDNTKSKKFTPLFANQPINATEEWTYGIDDNKYNINTQRNLYNMTKGNDAVEGTTKSDLDYLSSNFQQTGNITMTDDKTYNNYPVGSGGKPFKIKANRDKLWQKSIGDSDTPLMGSYIGKSVNKEGIDLKHSIIDKTSNAGVRYKTSLFGHSSGTISNIDYYLVNNQPSITADSLLISQNNGNVNNVTVSHANAGVLEILVNGANQEFGLVIGENVKNSSHRYEVSNITVNNIKATKSSANTSLKQMGGIIGVADNSNSDITNTNFNGILNVSGLDSVGGIVGQVKGEGLVIGNDNTTAISIRRIGSNKVKNVGGVIGQLSNSSDIEFKKVQISMYAGGRISTEDTNSNIGTLIGSSNGTTTIKMDNNVKFNDVTINTNIQENNALNTGGLIGNAKNTVIDVKNTTLNGDITTLNNNNNSTFGGLIGNVDGGSLSLSGNNSMNTNIDTKAQNVGGIVGNSKDANISIENTTLNPNINSSADNINSTFGGLIGNVQDGELIINDVNTIFTKQVLNDSYGNSNLLNAKYVGGLVGKLSSSNLTNNFQIKNSNVKSGSLYQGFGNNNLTGLIGGLVGQVDNATLLIEQSNNQLKTMIGTGTVGGLVGVSNNSDLTISDSSKTGRYFQPPQSSTVSDFGGLVGKVNKGKLNISNSFKQVEMNGSFATTINSIGGLVGNSTDAGLTIINSHNKLLREDGKDLDDSYVKNGGGLIGSVNKGKLTIDNVTNETKLINGDIPNKGYVGGLIGEIQDVSEFNLKNMGNQTINLQTGSKDGAGGLIGYLKNTSLDLNTLTLSGNIKSSSPNIGGLIGKVELDNSKTIKLSNITNNISINDNSTFNLYKTNPAGYTGGFIGFAISLSGTNILTIENSSNNGSVFTNNQSIGGAIGVSNIRQLNITNFSNNSDINYNKPTNSGNIDIAGVVGRISGGVANISQSKNIGLINIDSSDSVLIKASNFQPLAGGIVAKVSGSDVSISETYNSGKINVVDNSITSTAGGIIGSVDSSSKGTISNNYNIGTVNAKNIGGLVNNVDNKNMKFNYNYNAGLLNSYNGTADGISVSNLATDDVEGIKYNVSLQDSVKGTNSVTKPKSPEIELHQMQDSTKFNNATGWNVNGDDNLWKLDDTTNYTLSYLSNNKTNQFDKITPNNDLLDQYAYLQKAPLVTNVTGDTNGINLDWIYSNIWQKSDGTQNPLKGFKIDAIVGEKKVTFSYDIKTKKAEILGNMISISKINVVDNGNGSYKLQLSKDDVKKITDIINFGESGVVTFKVSTIRGNHIETDTYNRDYSGDLSIQTISLTGTDAETNATLDRLEVVYNKNTSDKMVLEAGKKLDGTGSIVANNYNSVLLNIPYEIGIVKLKLYANNPSSTSEIKLNGEDIANIQKDLQTTGEYDIIIPYGRSNISIAVKSSDRTKTTNYTINLYRLDKSELEKYIEKTENVLQYKDYFDANKIAELETGLNQAKINLENIKVSDTNAVTDNQITTAENSVTSVVQAIKTVYDDVVDNGIIDFNDIINADKSLSLLILAKEIFDTNKNNPNINAKPEWQAFKQSYENANKGLSANGSDMPMIGDVDVLCKDLLKSMVNINYKINVNLNTQQLGEEYEISKQKNQDDYTDESWTRFINIKQQAKNVLENTDSVQQQIDNMFINLWIANNILVSK